MHQTKHEEHVHKGGVRQPAQGFDGQTRTVFQDTRISIPIIVRICFDCFTFALQKIHRSVYNNI